MLVLEWKERAFIEKVNSRCFCWFPAAILVDQNGTPIWRLHTKLYKDAWNGSANNSETVGHKDLKLGQIVYVVVFYNFIFLCLFQWTVSNFFLLRDSENDLFTAISVYFKKCHHLEFWWRKHKPAAPSPPPPSSSINEWNLCQIEHVLYLMDLFMKLFESFWFWCLLFYLVLFVVILSALVLKYCCQ